MIDWVSCPTWQISINGEKLSSSHTLYDRFAVRSVEISQMDLISCRISKGLRAKKASDKIGGLKNGR